MDWVRAEISSKRTQEFYQTCYERLTDYREFGNAKLDGIDEPMIERFKHSLKKVSKTTANRYLCTLRKALRYACRKLKLVEKTPVIELYHHDKDNTVERECDYVYSAADYQAWLTASREPLRSASVLVHGGGLCRGELLALQWDCVTLREAPDDLGFWGTIRIRRGLKRKERRRDIPITEDMAAVLAVLRAQSKCQHVFTSLRDHNQPLSANTLADQHRAILGSCDFHPDAGLHSLRHTFLTEAGRRTQNVRALQKLAGHSKIQTTMRYIHPDESDMLEIAKAVQEARSKTVTAVLTTATELVMAESRKM